MASETEITKLYRSALLSKRLQNRANLLLYNAIKSRLAFDQIGNVFHGFERWRQHNEILKTRLNRVLKAGP